MAIGLLLAVGAGEVAMRVLGWPVPGFYDANGQLRSLNRPGAAGGAYPGPSDGRLRHYDYDVKWQVNADGFRDRAPAPKQAGERRLIILGDSFAAGMGVEEADRFSEVFAQRLRAQHPEVTVWNLGAPNCGTICEQHILGGIGRQYQPDMVVLAFYSGNDLDDNLADLKPEGIVNTHQQGVAGWLRKHSRLASFLWISIFRSLYRFKPAGTYDNHVLEAAWPATEKALDAIAQQVGPSHLALLYLPAVPEWSDATWKMLMEKYSADSRSRFAVEQRMQTWASSRSVAFIDSTPWVHASCPTVQPCVFAIDGHWKSSVQRMVGERLTGALELTIDGPTDARVARLSP